jgi:hypothetical protein
MVVIPQDPRPLLHILPIKAFWVGKTQPSPHDLKQFLTIRKNQVLSTLRWLVRNNRHYHDLIINYPLLSSWPDDFIPHRPSSPLKCYGIGPPKSK